MNRHEETGTISVDEALDSDRHAARAVVDIDEPVTKLVIFRLQDQLFAFPGSSIREIISRQAEVFPLPGMHPSVEGVMNLRGEIQSVLQLDSLLQLPANGTETKGGILLGEGAGMRTGIRIDELLDVTDIIQSQLRPPMEGLPAQLQPVVSAMLEYNGLPVTLLDMDLLLQAWQQACQ